MLPVPPTAFVRWSGRQVFGKGLVGKLFELPALGFRAQQVSGNRQDPQPTERKIGRLNSVMRYGLAHQGGRGNGDNTATADRDTESGAAQDSGEQFGDIGIANAPQPTECRDGDGAEH